MGVTLSIKKSGALCVCASLFLMLAPPSIVAAEDDTPPEPDDIWQGPMLGPVPATLSGGTVIDTAALVDLIKQHSAVLIDVLPAQRRPTGQTTPWMPVPHRNIPHSVWMPGVGSGIISQEMADYFGKRLGELTGQNREKLIVFYCRPNCWASWNAAKRAVLDGYRQVNWYPDGVEAWQRAGLPTDVSTPEGPGVQ